MARVWKTLLKPGVYKARQGTLRATPERCRRWASNFHAMRAVGLKMPIGWGHQPAALPEDDERTAKAKRQYELGAYNAGYIEDMRFDPVEGLQALLDAPGCDRDEQGNLVHWKRLPDGTEVKCAVGEVSAAIKDWTDGSGKLWPDSIVHVALTPLPVVHGTGGFRSEDKTNPEPLYLSLADFTAELGGDDVADEFDRDKGGVATDDEPDTDTDDTDNAMPDAEPEPPDDTAEEDRAGRLNEALKVLKDHNLDLPPDTTLDNLLERICVAGHVKSGMGAGAEPPADTGEDMGADNGDASAGGMGGGGMETEEQRPMMLSLATETNPLIRRFLEEKQEDRRKKQAARIQKMRDAGFLPSPRAAALAERASGYELSCDAETGAEKDNDFDRELSLLWEAYGYSHQAKQASMKGAKPRPRPDERERNNLKAQEEAGDELIAMIGVPNRKK